MEVKELSARRFAGCLRIGVTSLPLEVVAGWKYWTADTDSTGQSTVLDRTVTGRLCVCSKGSVSRERERGLIPAGCVCVQQGISESRERERERGLIPAGCVCAARDQ